MLGRVAASTARRSISATPSRASQHRSLPRVLSFEDLEDRRLLSVDMTVHEQLLWYLVNRARSDPAAEAARFSIDLNQGITSDFISPDPKPPVAPHASLVASARYFAQDMLDHDYFPEDHKDRSGRTPAQRAQTYGYPTSYVGENIGWGGTTGTLNQELAAYERHESLFRSPGHRENMLYQSYTDLGTGVRFGAFLQNNVFYNSSMAVEDFGYRNNSGLLSLVGVVFRDVNGNRQYDLNEGLGGVSVSVGSGLNTTTNTAGGWSIEVLPGAYQVMVQGGAFANVASASVYADQQNIEIDFISGQSQGIVNFRSNVAPVGAAETYVVNQNTRLSIAAANGVLLNDSDSDGDTLRAVKVSDPQHGTVSLSPDGSFSYQPAQGFIGIDSFTYRAVDGTSSSQPITVSLAVALPLGSIDFRKLTSQQPVGNELLFRFTAQRDGTLSALWNSTALGQGSAPLPSQSFTLYEVASRSIVPRATSDTRVNDNSAVAGREYLLRLSNYSGTLDVTIANLLQTTSDGKQMTFLGTSGNDSFEVVLGPSSRVATINGVAYTSTQVADITFSGRGGSDSVKITGSASNETAEVYPRSGRLSRLGLAVQWSDVSATLLLGGGGNDQVNFYDSPGDDTYVGTSVYGGMLGDGFRNEARFFADMTAHATTGGTDTVKLYDSAGNDELVATPVYMAMSGSGFVNRSRFFETAQAFATAGGTDTAKFYDSPGDDTFVATPTEAALLAPGIYYRAKFFEATHAFATAGGNDTAKFYDSPGDDTFYADPTQAALYKAGQYYNRAKFFEATHAFATAGGRDTATFVGSDANDIFYGDPIQCALYRANVYYNRAKFFEVVYAEAGAGARDEAYLYDSAGADLLEAQANWARLRNSALDFLFQASGFDYVKAKATTGGDVKTFVSPSSLAFEMVLEGPWQNPR